MPALLHPRLVRQHLSNLTLPPDVESRRDIVRGWIRELRTGRLAEANEVPLHGEVLTRMFGDVLGYRMRTNAGSGGAYELGAEVALGPTGKVVDGALGFFGGKRK